MGNYKEALRRAKIAKNIRVALKNWGQIGGSNIDIANVYEKSQQLDSAIFYNKQSVFNYKKGPTYRCLFPKPPKANSIPNCADIGVLGVLPGIVGCLQANELLKIICDLKGVLSGKLLSFNALTLEQRFLKFPKNNALKIDKLIDYEVFCGLQPSGFEITPENFNCSVSDAKYVLLDVRKKVERAQFNLGGMHIPLHELPKKINKIAVQENIVVYCEVGQRSLVATRLILEKYPDKKFALIIGEDNLASFHKWKNYEVILERYPLYVYPRNEAETPSEALSKYKSIHLVDAPKIEVASSQIREWIKAGKNVRPLLPQESWEYIDEMNFYK